jgi:flagellar biosynthetic protein FliR
VNDFSALARFGLLLVRPSMLVMAAPPLGSAFVPQQVRLGLALLLTLAITPIVVAPTNLVLIDLVAVVAREMAIGIALGLAIRALISGAELAGALTGYQIGFSYGSLIDPQSGVRNSMFTVLYANLAIATFLITNGHHTLIRALSASYAQIPIGLGHVDRSLLSVITGMLGVVFVLGVRLATPLILVLLVVEVALGMIARAAPAINLQAVSQPIRIVIGLAVIATLISMAPGLIGRYITPSFELGIRGALAFR